MRKMSFNEQIELIKENLMHVQARMAKSALKVGRDVQDIQLVAVTKLLPLETINAAIAAGHRSFGENYPEQAAEKITALETNEKLTWHMIGHIQSRKTDTVIKYFDWVQSVDRLKIARLLDRYSGEAGRVLPVLIEVNVSGEESKFGWKAWDEDCWEDLIPDFTKIAGFDNLEIHGLMCMPPFFNDPELSRPHYQRLKRLQSFLSDRLSAENWSELSIGTSFDYEVAIEEGATIVRLGTTIFGPRPLC